jgi:Trk K+ transport system NAD-binding subunit/nucleotide-binding universal stress UspA family protein
MKVLIAGSGRTAREILSRMRETWSVTLVDTEGERLELLQKTFRQVKETITGDASSLIILTEAGMKDADFVVAITDRDDVNYEISRLAKEMGTGYIVALVNDSRNLKKFEEIDVRAVCGPFLVGQVIQLYMENPRLFVTTIGEGKGEIMEVDVSRIAPVVGKRVEELGAKNWLIGAIYRGDELIIPDKETVIQAGDRVTIVGHTDLYQAIFHLFKLDQPSFPLKYGLNALAYIEGKPDIARILPEAVYLVKHTNAQKVVIFAPEEMKEEALGGAQELEEAPKIEFRKITGKTEEALVSASNEESVGCVLIPPHEPGFLKALFGQDRVISLALRLGSPLLLPRNSYPYRRILVPYNATKTSALALEIAHDIARQVDGKISVVIVTEPAFIRGDEPERWTELAKDHAREIAGIYRIPIELVTPEGNTVKEVVKLAADHDLVILGSTTENVPFLKPHVGQLIAERSPCSVMVVTL